MKYKPKNPVGAPRQMIGGKRRNIYIDEISWQKAKELGNGKPSEGIRRAILYYSMPDVEPCVDPSDPVLKLTNLRQNVGKKITD